MIAAIIQARTGSTRLPNKVFKILCDKPLIWHVVNRLKKSKRIDKIIIATTTNVNDDKLQNWAIDNNVDCFRGDELDVLDRFYKAASVFQIDTIVRITADDPFKDATVIDRVVDLYESESLDFAYNNNPPSFPEGLDTEVFSYNALEKAAKNAIDTFDREHVTQYFYKNAAIFKQSCLQHTADISNLRWTIDTQEDWDMTEIVYNRLFKKNNHFDMYEILELLDQEPEISEINSDVKRSTMYIKNNHI